MEITSQKASLTDKIRVYFAFAKLRLASLVVFSAVLGYLIAPGSVNWLSVIWLSLGGFLVTGASNGFNQIWEREADKKMDRTKNRPIPTGKMTVNEGLIVASLMALSGVVLLWQLNPLSAVLGCLALVLYVLVYTPLKPITPWAVFVGAFPGSIPPMLGYVAANGHFGLEPGILFLVQFFWQFPHFWAIAWYLHDDYKKGGFHLLPSSGGKDKRSAYKILFYTAMMIPVAMLPWTVELCNQWSMYIGVLMSIIWVVPAYRLYKTMEEKFAKQIMFGSFIYLPIILIIYLLDKV